jgi:hypothetical protein
MSNLKPNYSLVPEHLLVKIDTYCRINGKKKQKVTEEALELWIKENIGD